MTSALPRRGRAAFAVLSSPVSSAPVSSAPVSFARAGVLMLSALTALTTGCATYQSVSPAEAAPPADPIAAMVRIDPDLGASFCVIDSPAGRAPFAATLLQSLQRRGFEARLLPPGSSVAACTLTATYAATSQSYWRTFLATADITVYRRGERVGKAVYDARRSQGGVNLSHLIDPAQKIDELVDQLFPGRLPHPEARDRNPPLSEPNSGASPSPATPA